jgi:hypothetical protein
MHTRGDVDQLIAGLNINVQPGFTQITGQAHAARSIPKVFASARAYVQAGLAKYVFDLSCYIQAFAIEDMRRDRTSPATQRCSRRETFRTTSRQARRRADVSTD